MKLDVAIIMKNEEVMLADCLKSVEEADSIICVDTGSVDKTKEIASKYTDKIYDFDWVDDFSKARNYSISKATGDWILCLDCDNVLDPGGISKAKEAIKNTKAIALNITLYSGENSHRLPWLFKRCKENFYVGVAHETLSTLAQEDSGVRVNYRFSPAHAKDLDRVVRIMGKALEANPNLVRERFYFAREFYYRKEWTKAIEEFDKYLALATWLPEINEALYLKAQCLWNNGEGDKARGVCFEAIKGNPDFKKALLLMAEMYYEPWKSKWLFIANNAMNKDVLFA